MTEQPKDVLLRFGAVLARLLQWLSALAGGVALLLVPVVLLISQGMLPGLGGENGIDIVEASPLAAVALLAAIAASLATLFLFFGRLRAIIGTVQEGDPFIPENARRLEAMAWLLLGWEVLAVLVGLLRLHLANLVMEIDNSLDWSFADLDGLLVIVILFILARIFRHGAEMREDLEGTV
ncbi:DUF2975 domain-containing protein [Qipengyuania spongiae]|uniref:DUF2975 domain-containing protein n=1 Tax=Qipengyuania spongiae TaxID=2909673 RepID=A0ABY5T401_9SPHN|nr:DUF2975 domain-containing protein [Qipengyuania spongiae]UVI39709.1 DUF2975 domain-containing protein [Qipengyuania spongiae]